MGDWRVWLILAGRGFGKTRAGSEWVRMKARTSNFVNLMGATSSDARDIMIEGDSGILRVCPKNERPEYKAHKSQLIWPNGHISLIFTADSPERLRGKQHSALLMDELASYRRPDSYTQAMLGLRLGTNPQCMITTTPKPTKLLKEIMSDPNTVITRGSTYDNKSNLAEAFVEQIIRRYEGTRLGRQELNAEILDDNPHALWQRERLDTLRRTGHPDLKRVVVGIDPAVTSSAKSNMTGIIVAGIGYDYQGYILADRSVSASPDAWAQVAIDAYHEFKADRIIAEVNNGGDLVKSLIHSRDRRIPYKAVHASRGKAIRAEPISSLYEQGRVHHVGFFAQLEDQMCEWDPTMTAHDDSPDRMDALVWALTELMLKPQKTLIVV